MDYCTYRSPEDNPCCGLNGWGEQRPCLVYCETISPSVEDCCTRANPDDQAKCRAAKGQIAAQTAVTQPPPSCFARDSSTACRRLDAAASPAFAYDACYNAVSSSAAAAASGAAERVPMARLRAGDRVLTADVEGSLTFTRVIVTQHSMATPMLTSPMLTLTTGAGTSLTLTPDHALYLDGLLQPASAATAGATLTDAHGKPVAIRKVTHLHDQAVINPMTASATILASDKDAAGPPVLAASHPMWVAAALVDSPWPSVGTPLLALLSYAFPEATQAYYDAALEPLATRVSRHLDGSLDTARLPTLAVVAMLAVADVAAVGLLTVVVALGIGKLAAIAMVARRVRALGSRSS